MKKLKVEEVKEKVSKKVSPEEQLHLDARDARVKAVKDAIEAAKLARDEQEKAGLVEAEGAKADRLAKEKKDLEEASVVNKVEPLQLSFDFGRADLNDAVDQLAKKLNELVKKANE